MEEVKNFILYAIFRLIFFLTNILPERGRVFLGKCLGNLVYKLVKSRRKVTKNNLKLAYPDLTEGELEEITKKVFINMGLMLIEFIFLEKLNIENFRNYCRVEGEDYLKQAYKRGKGVIIYGAHFGNWEWMAAFVSLLGYPLGAIAARQHNSFFDKKINEIRENKGIEIIPEGISVRRGYKNLKKGKCLYILGDQDAREHGWKINFLGQPASTYPGAVQLARRMGAAIVPTFLIRKAPFKHHLLFKKPVTVSDDISGEEQKVVLQQLINTTEEIINKYPEQWFWLHKRWKTDI